jgi:N-methylhydantoinase B
VTSVDPITLEVLREAFVSIVREMRVTLVRTAYSSVLYEGEDFSCVLMDGDAQIVSMSKGQDHPLHIVPIAWSMGRCSSSPSCARTGATSGA